MTKDQRITVRITTAGLSAIEKIQDETTQPGEKRTDRAKVVCELLAVATGNPSSRQTVVSRLKQRKGIE